MNIAREIWGVIQQKVSYFHFVIIRNNPFSYRILTGSNTTTDIKVLGMIRLKNEELVLKDTLDAISKHVDAVVIFDDASTDNSVNIAMTHPIVKDVIVNKKWRRGRVWEETANRRLLFQKSKKYRPEWFFYCDADERFEGDIYSYLTKDAPINVNGVKIKLLDAYMTQGDHAAYTEGSELYNFRRFFGIEQRNILMIWRNIRGVDYVLPDSREPSGITGDLETRFYCQHYGKALSIDQWEENCRYYYENFPAYSEKWKSRMGKAIHTKSDFDTDLMNWEDAKNNSYLI